MTKKQNSSDDTPEKSEIVNDGVSEHEKYEPPIVFPIRSTERVGQSGGGTHRSSFSSSRWTKEELKKIDDFIDELLDS